MANQTPDLSAHQLAIIGHVVQSETPEDWALRVYNNPRFGMPAILAKIKRYEAAYMDAKDEPGYVPARQQALAEKVARQLRAAGIQAARNARAVAEAQQAEVDLAAQIMDEVRNQLAARNPT